MPDLICDSDCTELDFILAIVTMFDRLSIQNKKLLLKKLELLKHMLKDSMSGRD